MSEFNWDYKHEYIKIKCIFILKMNKCVVVITHSNELEKEVDEVF